MSKFILGDIHGSYATLMALIAKLPVTDYSDLVLCGDLIDRGPRSREVVEFVKSNNIDCVKGNHEDLMIKSEEGEYIEHRPASYVWGMNGGDQTRDSYKGFEDQYKEHLAWMKTLPLYLEYPEVKNSDGRILVVSHSNIGKVWDWSNERRTLMSDQFENTIMWDRYGQEDVPEIYNVVGHSVQREPKIRSFYACIDTGAVFKQNGYGKLTCLQFPEMFIFSQENCDD